MARQAKQRGTNPAAATPATTPAETQEDPKPVEGEEKQGETAIPEADSNNPAAATPATESTTTPAEPSPATPPDENEGSDDEPPADVVAGECILILKQKAALGNGTRARGEAICTISRGEDGHLDLESAEPVKGVLAAEVRTAINNLHLLDVAPITPPNDETE